MSKRSLLLIGLVVVLGGVATVGAFTIGGDPPAPARSPAPQLTGNRWSLAITATDAGFDMALDALPPGAAAFDLIVASSSPEELQIFRLEDGATFKAFAKAAGGFGNHPKLLRLATPMGGVGAGGGVPPGESRRIVLEMPEGIYALVSFIGEEDPLIRRFDVRAGQEAPAGIPSPIGDISMLDDSFVFPEPPMSAGVYRVTNLGQDVHEAAVFELEGSLSELLDRLNEEPQNVAGAGGFGMMDRNLVAHTQLSLPAGRYAFVCRVQDQRTGQPHYEEGMVAEFTVE